MVVKTYDYLKAINKWARKNRYRYTPVFMQSMSAYEWGILKRLKNKIKLEQVKDCFDWLDEHGYLKTGLISALMLKGVNEYLVDLKLRRQFY